MWDMAVLGTTVPVLLARGEPDDVAGAELLDRAAAGRRARPEARRDDEGLAERMGVPGGARARLEGDARRRDAGRCGASMIGSRRTRPVKYAAGPASEGFEPLRVICIFPSPAARGRPARSELAPWSRHRLDGANSRAGKDRPCPTTDLRRPHAVAGPRPRLRGGGHRGGQARRPAATRRPPTRRRSTPCAPSSTCSTSRASSSSARASATRRRCSTSARRSAPATAPASTSPSTRSKARRLTAKDMPNALAVIAMGPRGSMLHAPDVYMDKLAIGPGYPHGHRQPRHDRRPSASARSPAPRAPAPSGVMVCVLERPRHEALIAENPRDRRPHPADHRRRRRRASSTAPSPPRPASTCTWARAARPRACSPPRR